MTLRVMPDARKKNPGPRAGRVRVDEKELATLPYAGGHCCTAAWERAGRHLVVAAVRIPDVAGVDLVAFVLQDLGHVSIELRPSTSIS